MQLTKRNLIKTAAIGSAFVGALAIAAPASANSFGPTDYGTGGYAMVSYNDETDTFCVSRSGTMQAWDFTTIRIYPETSSRGPSYNFNVWQGQTKCVSLERAYEDTYYYYRADDETPINFYS